MQSNQDHAVHLLNSLIETTLDSVHGYRDAAEAAHDPQLRSLLSSHADKRMEVTRRLQQEVRSFGAEPEDDQSILGKLHNKFAELRGKLANSDDHGVIDEVERGEDFIKAKFEKATHEDLPASAQQTIEAACRSIREDHDTISRMKHQRH